MTQLNIAGKVVQVDDSFLKLSPEDQGKTVDEIAGQIGVDKAPDPAAEHAASIKDVGQGRAEGVQMLRGVPIAGAYADKAAAALNAAAQPIMETGLSKAPTFAARMAENQQRIKAGADAYEAENPIKAGVEQMTGGTAAMAPLAASGVAARALGMSGTLPQMVTRGAMSGAAIGAADAAARGDDIGRSAGINAVAGAGLPVAGRLIGKAVTALRPGEAIRPNPTVDVNGAAVPQFESQRTGDNLAGSREQAALSGAVGPEAQRVAQEAFDARAAATEQARSQMGDQLSASTNPDLGAAASVPGEPSAVATPHVAGDQVITELAQRHNDQLQQNALRGISGEVSDFQTRAGMVPPGADQQILAPTARDATGSLQNALQEGARTQAAARTAAYQRAGDVPGQFEPAAFDHISTSLQNRLNQGPPENRVRINERTPLAREALDTIEREIGSGRVPTNDASARITNYNDLLNAGTPTRPIPPITGRDVESVRQQLVPLMRDANAKARGPMPDATDARAMRRIMDAFDQHVRDTVQAGGFSGNGEELLRRQANARQLHQQFRQNFSSRGSGDIVGPVMERVLGKYPGQEITPEAFADSLFGSSGGTGGNKQVALAQHVRGIVGPDSAQWAATKQGVLSHLLDVPEGNAALSPAKRADRINEFVNGKGNSLAQVFFSPEERRRLVEHADVLRSLVPHEGPPTAVDRQVLRLSGADGHPPATSRDAVDMLFTGDGTKAGSVQLAKRLKTTLSPEAFDSIRQAMWGHLTTKPEGMIEYGPQALSQRLSKFLSEPMAETLYSAKERQMMRILQDQYKSMIPLPNTTNPSGSGIFAAKMVNAAKGNLLPMLGLATHGVGGVLAGAAGNKVLAFVSNRRAVNQTKDLFYGRAAKAATDPRFERAAAIAAKAAMPLIGGGR